MSAIDQEYRELVADIQYLESLVNQNRDEFKRSLQVKLSNAISAENRVDLTLDELALFMAKISARASVIESNLGVDAISADLQSSESGQATIPLVDTLKLSIVDIGQHNHLGGLYHTENNVPYCFMPPDKKVVADLYIDRSNAMTLAINTPVCSDDRILNNLKIEVDGIPLKHKIATIEGDKRLVAHLPKSKSKAKTHLALITPVATAKDTFRLGISDIYCVKRQTLKNFVKNKLGS